MPEQDINRVQIPHPSKATFKFPPSRAQSTVKCPGYARGGGCLSFNLTGTLANVLLILARFKGVALLELTDVIQNLQLYELPNQN